MRYTDIYPEINPISQDEKWMLETFELALKGKSLVQPNPLVGCVIVKDNKLISQGHHSQAGEPHAEAMALNNLDTTERELTLYCNLEPCVHTNKRTPPCAPRIIQYPIKKVVIAQLDPNPEVAGKGVQLLRDHGVEVVTGILEKEALRLNEVFNHHIIHQVPFIELKVGTTLDLMTADFAGKSQWITNELSREHVHRRRLYYQAIGATSSTIINDQARLTARVEGEEYEPELVIFSTQTPKLPSHLSHRKVHFVSLDFERPELFQTTLKDLYQKGISSIYLEVTGKVLNFFIEHQYFDRLSLYQAPKILGGGNQILQNLFESNPKSLNSAIELKELETRQLGNDLYKSYRRVTKAPQQV